MPNFFPRGFHPVRGGEATITYYPVAATQTLARGDLVLLDAAGEVTIGLASSTALLGSMAMPAASLATSTLVAVYAEPHERYRGTYNAAVTATVDAGNLPDLIGATGAMMIDEATARDGGASDSQLHIVQVSADPDNVLTSAGALGIVRIENAIHQS